MQHKRVFIEQGLQYNPIDRFWQRPVGPLGWKMKKKASQFGDDIAETIRYLEELEIKYSQVRDKEEINNSMKLIVCTKCGDVVALRTKDPRACLCGKSSGFYTGEKEGEAKISGPCIPIGFGNRTFTRALRSQPESGYGLRFEAFIIPKKVPSVIVEEKKNDAAAR